MTRILIDCGTHLFQGFETIRREYGIDPTWECWCYEANPITYERAFPIYQRLVNEEGLNIHFLNRAMSDREGTVEVHCAREGDGSATSQASNILDTPPVSDGPGGGRFTYDAHHEVEADDIAEVLANTVRAGSDFCILKLDVEGSEFAIMDRLFETETINLVDVALVEWHQRFFPNPTEYEARIATYQAACADCHVELRTWL